MVVEFINALNTAVVAGWLLHVKTHDKSNQFTHLDFRRNITIALLRMATSKNTPRPGPKSDRSLTYRKTDGHSLRATDQGRCAQCGTNARLQCHECKKRLHLHCFPKCIMEYKCKVNLSLSCKKGKF